MALLSLINLAKGLTSIKACEHAEHCFQSQIARPLTWRRRIIIALGAMALMIGLRASVEPIIGSDVSFTVFFPVVIIAALSAGSVGGIATVGLGAIVAILFSTRRSWDGGTDSVARLAVWLVASSIAALASLALRQTMLALQRRESDLRQATEQLYIVVGELEHRGKNALAVVEALSVDAAQNSGSVEEYKIALSSKIKALASGYAFLTRRKPAPLLLGSIVSEVLRFFEGRIEVIGGPLVWLAPNVCIVFALALHELATNAAKHGALSISTGMVVVSWRIIDGRQLCFVWTERHGPAPTESVREGFGSRMIQKAFQQIPGGCVTSETHPDGIVWRLDLDYGLKGPSRPVDEDDSDDAGASPLSECSSLSLWRTAARLNHSERLSSSCWAGL